MLLYSFYKKCLFRVQFSTLKIMFRVCVKIDIEGEGEKRGKEGRERIQLSNKGGGRQGVNLAMLSDSVELETEGCGCQESAKIEKSVSRSFHDEVIPK